MIAIDRDLRFILATVVMALSAPTQAQDAPFTVGTASAPRGTTAYGELSVPAGSDAPLSISVAVVNGVKPGPVVAFVAGSHGAEYASIVALTRLTKAIDPMALSGTVSPTSRRC